MISRFFIEIQCPCLKDNTIFQFALDDISLMTDNPAKAMIELVECCKTNAKMIMQICDDNNVKFFYDICEEYLKQKNLLNYDLNIDCIYGVEKKLSEILKKDVLTNYEDVVNDIISYCSNNNSLRNNNHSILTEKLIEYKQKTKNHLSAKNEEESSIFNDVFFNTFGFPIIDENFVDIDQKTIQCSNIERFPQKNR